MNSRRIIALITCLVAAVSAMAAPASFAGRSRAPTAYTGEADQLPGFAELYGRVENHGLVTGWRFKWGHTEAYGHITEAPVEPAFNGPEPVEVDSPIDGLRPGTIYHYRLVAVTSAGKSIGKDRKFRAVPRG